MELSKLEKALGATPRVTAAEQATKSLKRVHQLLGEAGTFRTLETFRLDPEVTLRALRSNAEKEIAPIQTRDATYALTEAVEALLESSQEQAKAINSLATSSRLTAWLTGALALMTLAVLVLTALLVT